MSDQGITQDAAPRGDAAKKRRGGRKPLAYRIEREYRPDRERCLKGLRIAFRIPSPPREVVHDQEAPA